MIQTSKSQAVRKGCGLPTRWETCPDRFPVHDDIDVDSDC